MNEDATPESPLSLEYRRLMRWYPERWGRANEDAMLGALLDQADSEGRRVPARAERAALTRAGIAERLGLNRLSRSRLTLTLGGVGIILATIVPVVSEIIFIFPLSDGASWLYFLWRPVYPALAAALLVVAFIVLAFGVGRESGIAGRSIIGRVALILFPTARLVAALINTGSMPELGAPNSQIVLLTVEMWGCQLVFLAGLIVAAVMVAKAGIARGLGRWGLVALAVVEVVATTMDRFVLRALEPVAFWLLPVALVIQLAIGVVFLVSAQTGVATERRSLRA
jgi:hypothetical protein